MFRPVRFKVRLGRWAESVCLELELDLELDLESLDQKKPLSGLAIDGKTLRGSKKQGALFSHLLSAVVHKIGITLIQLPASHKTNEIPIIQYLLRELFLEGRVVTVDALLAQREIADSIVDLGGHYFMNVKLNQPTVHNQIKDLFDQSDQQQINSPPANSSQTNADQDNPPKLSPHKIKQLSANTSSPDEPLAAKQANLAGPETDLDQAHQLMQVPRMPTDKLIEVLEPMLANRPMPTDELIEVLEPMLANRPITTDEPIDVQAHTS